jgi:type III secretion protein C
VLQQGLIGYGDGQVLYLYDASEAKSSAVALRHISVDRLRALMRRSGLDESRYPCAKAASGHSMCLAHRTMSTGRCAWPS